MPIFSKLCQFSLQCISEIVDDILIQGWNVLEIWARPPVPTEVLDWILLLPLCLSCFFCKVLLSGIRLSLFQSQKLCSTLLNLKWPLLCLHKTEVVLFCSNVDSTALRSPLTGILCRPGLAPHSVLLPSQTSSSSHPLCLSDARSCTATGLTAEWLLSRPWV